MNIIEQERLKKEIQHIFDSGANEVRVFNMVNAFVNSRICYTGKDIEDAYDRGYNDCIINRST
jgi:hypothetical protein